MDNSKNDIEHWTVSVFLAPGNWVVNYFDVKDYDNRMLLRMYLNLAIYAKVFGTIAYVWAG